MENHEAMMKKILEREFEKTNAWQAWAYIINAMAIGLSNALDPDPVRKGTREKEYTDCIHRLDNKDAPAEVLGVIAMAEVCAELMSNGKDTRRFAQQAL